MTARPTDWSPVDRDSDPVPGDPYDVLREGLHYANVATEIEEQVARLRRLAHPDDELHGEYTEPLRKGCEDLADHMSRAHGRFDTVGEQLKGYYDDFLDAQEDTKAALDAAEGAQGSVDAANPDDYSTIEMMDSDNTEAQAAKRRLSGAQDDLDQAKRDCDTAVDHFDGIAHTVAEKIKDACDDDLKDGWFDGIKAWVKDHVEILKAISTWLGRIVLVLAIIVVCLSNPAGWVALLAMASVLLLSVDTLLAASGEGSWADVAFDVVGVATLGIGSVAGKLARFGRSMTLFKAGNARGIVAARSSLRAAFSGSGVLGRMAAFGRRFRPSTYGDAFRAYRDTAAAVRRTPFADAPLGSAARWPFSREASSFGDDLARIEQEFGSDSINALHRGGVSAMQKAAGVAGVNTAVDTALDEGSEQGIPGLDDLNTGLDNITTREYSPLW